MINLSGIVILAGGESSRMGSPKALLKLPNAETLLEFHIRHAKMLNVPVMVADNGKNFCQHKTVKIIDDYLPEDTDLQSQGGKGVGALSAIASAMNQVIYPNDYLMVISCDSLINAHQLFETLFHQITYENEDVIYLKGEKDYPLLGLYHVILLPKLKEYLDSGNRALMKFLKDKKVKTVDLPSEWVSLANFNTKNEFELTLEQLTKSKQ